MTKRALIVGAGLSGKAAIKLLQSRGGWELFVHDDNALPSEIEGFSPYGSDSPPLESFSLLVLSPGIAPTHPLVIKAKEVKVPVVGEVELAFSQRKAGQRFIGITGTNGKTTTTLLTAHILNAAGIRAHAAGNVGKPLSEELLKGGDNDCFVVELSSYQLEALQLPVFDVGLLLNISSDHLSRHGTMEAYAQAKAQLGRCMKQGAPFFVEQQAHWKFRSAFEGIPLQTIGYNPGNAFTVSDGVVMKGGEAIASYPMERCHHPINIAGVCAAVLELGVSSRQIAEAIESFHLPEHRMEYVRHWNGIAFYNDSKGTNVDAVIHAVGCLKGPLVLIAGGVDKGGEYLPWIKKFSGKVKAVCAIGEAAQKIRRQLEPLLYVELCENLEAAVARASLMAASGESILLSPGCASFDMFDNYMHRGEEFKRIVNSLK